MRRYARPARRSRSSPTCRPASSSTTSSATTTTRRNSMSSLPAAGPKPKKSVALSGVPAGNTALCTVGRTGNDLHYRGYDILDFADQAEFEEIAYLLVHEKLPTRAELAAYKKRLQSLRGLPAPLKTVLEQIPKSAHPRDVTRPGCPILGPLERESEAHPAEGARAIADRLMACF